MFSSGGWGDEGVSNFAKIDIGGGSRQKDGLAGVDYSPVLESAFGRGGIGRGRGRGGHPMNSAQNGFVSVDYCACFQAIDTDMRGVCKFVCAKMEQKLAVQQL
uniref:Uncharacterized protein n=1 Tax=Globodera pallida TaxID=36090 RepID=A0A183BUH9_GLOPA